MPLSSMTEGTMDERDSRRDAPLVCVTDGKHHIRQFLREVLSRFSFTIYECIELCELNDRRGHPTSWSLA
jgi:hypothetical protein